MELHPTTQTTPNLFIAGAARCGTSSLHAILRQHPDIYAPGLKEPGFFNWPFQAVSNPLAYFGMYTTSKTYRLDASVNYLANPRVPYVLSSVFPEAKFIISLRDPKQRAFSLYCLMRAFGSEDGATFMQALQAEKSRHASPDFFLNCPWGDPMNYLYCHSSMFDEQIARYFEVFRREQFLFLSLAELSKDPLRTTQRVLTFLQLDARPAETFEFHPLNNKRNGRTFDEACDSFMSSAFTGLMARTEALIDQQLDWSL